MTAEPISTSTSIPPERSGSLATRLTGAQAVARVIAAQEDPLVLGMPGGHTVQIYDALYSLRDTVDTRLVRQESIATVMAEAHGRLTGAPAFVIGQGAWVLGNASIGIMEAHLGASPMVLLIDATDGGGFSHHGPYQAGFGGYGAYDLAAALRAITKQTFIATDATQALQMTQLAVKHARTGEPGPVAVVFHSRALFGRVEPDNQPPSFLGRIDTAVAPTKAEQPRLQDAAELFATSVKPVIIAGNGVRLAKAQRALVALAERLGAPVATTTGGKGVFPEDHELAVGVMGSFGHDSANAVVADADVLLAVGTKLGASDTANANPRLMNLERQRLVHIDVEALNTSWTWPSDVAVIGDARDALERLVGLIVEPAREGEERASSARRAAGAFERQVDRERSPLSGRDVIATLSKTAPEGTVVTCDAGENRLFVLREFQVSSTGTVLQPSGGGGMGYAIPAATAAARDLPGRQIVAVCGDGGFSMSLTALMSAIELGSRLTVLVLDNGVLGWVYNGQRGRSYASELQPFDYAAVAESMGAQGHRVQNLDQLSTALDASFGHAGVSVIIARTTPQDRYQDLMSSLNTVDVYAVHGDE
jgi:acetolactate synthase-1/2/3 large subunit